MDEQMHCSTTPILIVDRTTEIEGQILEGIALLANAEVRLSSYE